MIGTSVSVSTPFPPSQRQNTKNEISFQVVLGVIDVASSRIETVEEIRDHISDVLKYIPKERLVIAPDCGLVYLNEDMILKKITNMVAAARQF